MGTSSQLPQGWSSLPPGWSTSKPAPQQDSAPQQPGFWENLGHSFGIGQQESDAAQAEFKAHPILSSIPGIDVARGLYQGGKRIAGELQQAGSAAMQGNPAGVAVHAVQAVPFVGPAMDKMSDEAPAAQPGQSYASQVMADATPGNIGTALGTAMQVAPMALGAVDTAFPKRPIIPTPNIPVAIGRAALLGRTPEAAYESALKPSTTLSVPERAAAIQTGLHNSIPITKGGLTKIGGLIDDLNQRIAGEIASDPNRPIDPNLVATRADQARAKFSRQVNAGGDLQAIEDSRRQFLSEQGATPTSPAPPMGAADAQAMKQGTYRVLAGKYGEQGSASVEAQKALARGLKEEIATQFPEIGNLNAAESRLLDLQPILERAVNRISNHQAVGIGSPIAGTAASAITGSGTIGGVVTVLKGVLDNPAVKSRLAIAVSKGSKIPYSNALSKVAAYSTALGAAASGSQDASNDGSPNLSQTQGPSQ